MRAESNNGFIFTIIKGACVAVITALIGVLVFAAIVKIFALDNSVVKIVSQFIKILSIFLGCVLALKENKGIIKGAIVGVLSTAVICLIFKLIGGEVCQGTALAVEFLFSLIVGAISGIIAINLKNS